MLSGHIFFGRVFAKNPELRILGFHKKNVAPPQKTSYLEGSSDKLFYKTAPNSEGVARLNDYKYVKWPKYH